MYEAELVVYGFLQRLVCDYGILGAEIGVICLYQAQRAKIAALLDDACQASDLAPFANQLYAVQISTVDAFQGAERGVIILATTKSACSTFLESPKRLNVALTRGKSTRPSLGHSKQECSLLASLDHLFVTCNVAALASSPLWRRIFEYARKFPHSLTRGDRVQSIGFAASTAERK